MNKVIGIIPARYASTRLPGKPMLDIGGKTMIQRVYEQCLKSNSLDELVVATDSPLILEHVMDFGGKAVMTADSHNSGTSRCWEAYCKAESEATSIINIQGDEPFIQPEQIDLLVESLSDKDAQIATLIKRIIDEETLFDPSKPKVVTDKKGFALYFSRSTVPFIRDRLESQWIHKHNFYKHIGIYAYKSDVLKELIDLESSTLEKAEQLEQLSWLEHGYRIKVAETDHESIGIDTEHDLQRVKAMGLF